MINVFSFVASCRGENSTTARFSDMVAERLKTKAQARGLAIQYERLNGKDFHVNFCLSCENCFKNGSCSLDKTDDMSVLKQKFMDADIVLFASPVYIGSMSGLAKCVLDRLSFWSHQFELAGKTMAVLVTTSNNHGTETVELLCEPFRFMGASIAYAGHVFRHNGHPNINLQSEMDTELDQAAEKLLDCYENPASFIEPWQNTSYKLMCQQVRRARVFADIMEAEPSHEVIICEKRRFTEYKTLQEYVLDMKERQG